MGGPAEGVDLDAKHWLGDQTEFITAYEALVEDLAPGLLERLDYKYSVTAQIEDIPNAAYTPRDAPQTPACAALRVNIEWYETRPVVENTLSLVAPNAMRTPISAVR